jgi:hypothetical protein
MVNNLKLAEEIPDIGKYLNIIERLQYLENTSKDSKMNIQEKEEQVTSFHKMKSNIERYLASVNRQLSIKDTQVQKGKNMSILDDAVHQLEIKQLDLFPISSKQQSHWNNLPDDNQARYQWLIADIASRAKNDIIANLAGDIAARLEIERHKARAKNTSGINLPAELRPFYVLLLKSIIIPKKTAVSDIPDPDYNEEPPKPEADESVQFKEMKEFNEWFGNFDLEAIFEAPKKPKKKKKQILIDVEKEEAKGKNKGKKEIDEEIIWELSVQLVGTKDNARAFSKVYEQIETKNVLGSVINTIKEIFNENTWKLVKARLKELDDMDMPVSGSTDSDVIIHFDNEENYRQAVMNLMQDSGLDFVQNDAELTLTFNNPNDYDEAKQKLEMSGITTESVEEMDEAGLPRDYDSWRTTDPNDKYADRIEKAAEDAVANFDVDDFLKSYGSDFNYEDAVNHNN